MIRLALLVVFSFKVPFCALSDSIFAEFTGVVSFFSRLFASKSSCIFL
jgi:hypothetical protein